MACVFVVRYTVEGIDGAFGLIPSLNGFSRSRNNPVSFKWTASGVQSMPERCLKMWDDEDEARTFAESHFGTHADIEFEIVPLCSSCWTELDDPSDCHETSDGDSYCDNCGEDVWHCEECEECYSGDAESYSVEYPHPRSGRVTHRLVCQDCFESNYFHCSNCGDNHHDSLRRDVNGYSWCDSCCDDNAFTCDECDGTYSNDDMRTDSDDRCLCRTCYRDAHQVGGDGTIHPYNTRMKFSPVGSGPLLGLELEVMVKERSLFDAARDSGRLLGKNYIFKEDGSLRGGGFEIVSQAMDLEAHKTNMEGFLDAVPQGIHSFRSKLTGIHVHLDRMSFKSEGAVRRFIGLIYNKKNRQFIRNLAQRDSEDFASCHSVDAANVAKKCADRYQAVNTQNEKTIEVRIFKGNVKKESVFRALEFCDALREWSNQCGRFGESINADAFQDWILSDSDRCERWPNMAAFACKKKMACVR